MRCTGILTLAVSGAVAVLTPLGLALAQDASYQTAELVLENAESAAATPLRLGIDYVNPADPAAKPPAVMEVVETLPPGSRIDTSVPEACTASDAELASSGQGACPPGSRVGGGEVDLDTGTATLAFEVTLFSNRDQLILLFEQKGGGVRTPSRARVDGDRPEGPQIVAQVPPIPGGPPDGFTAIERVRLRADAITRDGRSYVTTPDSCPPAGSWTSRIDFVYRNGTRQTTTNPSPCRGAGSGAVDRSPPRITVRGVPGRCASRDFRVRVRIRDASGLRRAGVRLDGRLLRRAAVKRFGVGVPVRGHAGSEHTLTVVARDEHGNRARTSRRFVRCR